MTRKIKISIRSACYFFLLYSCLIYFPACKGGSDSAQTQVAITDSASQQPQGKDIEDSLQKELEKLSEDTDERIRSMKLAQPIRNAQRFFFSNKETQDEFSFYIPVGPVGETKSIMTISTSGKDLIFSDTINTISLAQWMAYPDEVPANLNRIQYLHFMINYLNRLSEKDVQEFLEDKAGTIFSRIFTEKAELRDPETMALLNKDIPKELYNEVMSSDDTNIIFWPCYNCEEGGNYLGYSKSKKTVINLASSD